MFLWIESGQRFTGFRQEVQAVRWEVNSDGTPLGHADRGRAINPERAHGRGHRQSTHGPQEGDDLDGAGEYVRRLLIGQTYVL